jgi:hypothetical protein
MPSIVYFTDPLTSDSRIEQPPAGGVRAWVSPVALETIRARMEPEDGRLRQCNLADLEHRVAAEPGESDLESLAAALREADVYVRLVLQ